MIDSTLKDMASGSARSDQYSEMKKNAFTLIELLVVIAIIGLLLAIIMPSMKSAKEQAKAALCMSNQRQIGIAFSTYAQSNKGTVPPTVHWDNWWAQNGFHTWAGQLYYEEQLIDDSTVFHCPAAKMPGGRSKKWGPPVPGTGPPYAPTPRYPDPSEWEPRWTYGLRMLSFAGATMDEIKLESLKSPSTFFMLTDTTHPDSIVPGVRTAWQMYIFDYWHPFFMLHRKGANVLCGDLSVDRYLEDQIAVRIRNDDTLGPFAYPPFIYPDGRQSGDELMDGN